MENERVSTEAIVRRDTRPGLATEVRGTVSSEVDETAVVDASPFTAVDGSDAAEVKFPVLAWTRNM
jgi:hypothetical protein